MRRRGLWRLVASVSCASLVAGLLGGIGIVSSAGPAAAAGPSCTFTPSGAGTGGGTGPTSISGVVGGTTKVAISCTGLTPPTDPYIAIMASPLGGVVVPPGSNINEADLGTLTSLPGSGGSVSGTLSVPSTFTATDSNAVCPPTQAQVNAGLVGCAVAVADEATQAAVPGATALLLYATGQPTPAAPSLTLSPTTAKSGDTITVSGSNWWGNATAATSIPASDITVGGVTATTASVSVSAATWNGTTLTPPQISGTFTVPSGVAGGSQPVTITEPNSTPFPGPVKGTSSLNIEAPPTVTSISPTSGPTTGGTSVTITGTNFTGATAVKFGTTNAASFTVNSATSITATSPAESAGTVDVTVTTPAGTSATSAADQFTFTTPVSPPTVTSVSPTSGPTTGGTSVTITGTNFTGATAVKFGTTNAASFTVNSATSITATSPAESAGTVDVTVTTPAGTSATSAADQFTFVAAGPTVTSISPTSGPTTGGTSVTITGTNFTGATAVKFGTASATFTVNSATSISATSPPGTAGTVDVTVTTPAGTSPTSPADQFTYTSSTGPTVTGVVPNSGPAAGGTFVTITGTNLESVTNVKFGSTNAEHVVSNTSTSVSAQSPPGTAGQTVDITVSTINGTSPTNSSDKFTYTSATPPAAPTISTIVPNNGPTTGGTSVTITGTNFSTTSGATSFTFGGVAATGVSCSSTTQCTMTSPPFPISQSVVVLATVDGASSTPNITTDIFTYTTPAAPPTVTKINPTSGPTTGGTTVTITGTNFTGATAVDFGTTNAASFTVNSDTSITAVSPPGTGTVDVTVTTPAGTSATSPADQFTYIPPSQPPTVTKIHPKKGPASGGTTVTITGTNFTGATAVKFGTTNAASFTVNSDTSITAVSPPGTGTVDVTVTTPAGTSATSPADQFTYIRPHAKVPFVRFIFPYFGPRTGGTLVWVVGYGFLGTTKVDFGTKSARFLVVNRHIIAAISPPGKGTVEVTVTTPAGTSVPTQADTFTYFRQVPCWAVPFFGCFFGRFGWFG